MTKPVHKLFKPRLIGSKENTVTESQLRDMIAEMVKKAFEVAAKTADDMIDKLNADDALKVTAQEALASFAGAMRGYADAPQKLNS